jgi:protein-tyrosine phosphatase
VRAELYPIVDCPTGRLAIMPRPRAGDWLEDEVRSWRHQGLDIVVSLLEESEVAELDLADEAQTCAQVGLRWLNFPVPDCGVPASARAVSALVTALVEELRAGKGVGIHCRIGVGRSSCVAACILAALGMSLETAWGAVERARGLSVPDTEAQRAWVEGWCSAWEASHGTRPRQLMPTSANPPPPTATTPRPAPPP